MSITEEYKKKHPISAKLHERALSLFAGNGATHAGRIFDPFMPYITHASGSRKWDVDGNGYICFSMCHGALLLGHNHPKIVEAVQDQLTKGVQYGSNHELEIEWAELIQSIITSAERVEFAACGNEANMLALRLGRVFTGRNKVLKFKEHFHGWNDQLVPPERSAGVLPEDNRINTVAISANDLNRVEQELAKREYAVLITEGGGAHMGGQIPLDNDFTQALPDLTKKYGTIWVVDEVVTGFRELKGSWQSLVGVKPDLTTLGKCAGGGLAVGAVIGRADIMDAFNPTRPVEKRIIHSGTWNATPLVAAAGVAACRLYKTGEHQKRVAEMAAYFRKKANNLLEEKGIDGRFYGRNIIQFYIGPADFEPADDTLPPTKDVDRLMNRQYQPVLNRLRLHLLQRGVACQRNIFIMSSAHTKEDINYTIEALADSLDAISGEGLLRT
ncbi:aspartate aminotransferase family protein [Chloroflexota bacterium]